MTEETQTLGTEVPENPQPPIETPTVSEPVNQPPEEKAPESEQKPVSKFIYRYTYGVYAKGNDRSPSFEIEFLAVADRTLAVAQQILSENVDNMENYVIRVVRVVLVSRT